MSSDNIKRRLQRAEKISGEQPFALLTDEELDARIEELSIKGGLPPLEEAIKIYGSLHEYIKVFREAMKSGDLGSIVQTRAAS